MNLNCLAIILIFFKKYKACIIMHGHAQTHTHTHFLPVVSRNLLFYLSDKVTFGTRVFFVFFDSLQPVL